MVVGAFRQVGTAARQPGEEHGNEDGGDEGGGQHAPEHARAHGFARRGAGPAGLDQGEDAEDEGQGGHDDGAEAQAGAFQGGFQHVEAFRPLLGGELDDQDGVLRRQADQHHQADLEVDVVGHAADHHRRQGAEEGEGHGQDHRQGQGPLLVLGRQDQEHHDDAEAEGDGGGGAGALFLEGLAGPFQLVAGGQGFLGHFLDDLDGVAGTDLGHGTAHDLGGEEAVEALQLFRADHGLDLDQGRDGHHGTAAALHVHPAQVFRLGAELAVGLELHPVGAAVEVEVIDVECAHGGLQRLIHVADGDAHGDGLGFVDLDAQLGRGGAEEGVDAHQLLALLQALDELLHDAGKLLGIGIAAGLDVGFETAGVAQAADGGRVEHQAEAVRQHHAHAHELLGQVVGAGLPFVPVLQRDEDGAGIGLHAAADDVVTGDDEDPVHCLVLLDHGLELVAGGAGALQAGAVGQHQGADQVALVFRRHETAGHGAEHEEAAAEDDDASHGTDDAVVQGLVHRVGIGLGEALEEAVEGTEDDRLFMLGLQQQGAQGRRQGQGDDAGEGDGDGHGDGELLVQHAGDAAEEGDGDEHRAQHQDDGHHGAGNFAHGFDGRFLGRHLLFPHQALDVLQHHDGVVHHDTDGQHHGEQGQGVNGEAEQPQPGEGADQGDGHGHQGNHRGAPVLQEDEDDDGHQDQGFHQGVHHFGDGGLDELGGVERHHVIHVAGELLLQFVHAQLHLLGHVQGVGAGLQEDADADHGLAQQGGGGVVVLGAQLDPGHILQVQGALGAVGADDDVAELFRRRQAALGGHRVDQLLAVGGRLLADLAGGVLLVLGGDGVGDFRRRHPQLGHAVWPQPQPHGVVQGAEDLGVADAGNALQVVQDIDQGVVGQVQGRAGAFRRGDGSHHQDVVGTLLHGHAVLAHHVRQARLGDLDPVVHVHRGHVHIGADLEGGGDGEGAVGGGRGVEIHQVFNAGELLLDGGGDGLGQGFGGGAGVGGGNDHRRRRDFRVLGNGQHPGCHDPGDDDDDGDDRCEDRSIDEKA